MSDYSYKSHEELELLRRADKGDTEALKNLISYYWHGHEKSIPLNKTAARNCINKVENSAKQGNRLAMGLVASHYRLYSRPEGPPNEYPLFSDALAYHFYEQLLKEAEAGIPSSMLAASWYELITPKTESFKYLLRSGERGCAEAFYFLALAYYRTFWEKEENHGVWDYGIQIDDNVALMEESMKWFRKGAASDSIYKDECLYKLAQNYYESSSNDRLRQIANDPERHNYLKCLKEAASLGHLRAKSELETYEKYYLPASKKGTEQQKSDCYIATAVYGSYDAPEVLSLRCFRDGVLNQSILGRLFIRTYYKLSPNIAKRLKNTHRLNCIIRCILNRFIEHFSQK